MKKTARNILIGAALSVCALSMAAFAACGGSTSTSLRTQLDAVDPETVTFDFDAGTFSFKAVENATYYRVYFYNVEEPNEDLDNYDYFVYTTDADDDAEDTGDTASAKSGSLVAYADEADENSGENTDTQEGDGTEQQEGGDTEYPDAGGEGGGDEFVAPEAGDAPDMGGGDSGSSVTYTFETDADGNYVLQDYETILSQSATYSKRYNAYYYDEETDTKTYYEAGDTVTFTLPNDSISGGRYIIGIKSGGTLALYTLSDWCVVDTSLKLQYVTPEINSGEWSWSWSVTDSTLFKDPSNYTEEANNTPMGGTTKVYDQSDVYPEANGMMFELVNADTMYAADPSMELTFYITDSTGAKVSFTYYDLNMSRADSNDLDYWLVQSYGTSVTEGTMTLGYSVYSHSGPTMFYAAYGYTYILGLTTGTEYTFHIQAIAPSTSTTAVSSSEGTFTFTAEVQTSGTT